MTNSSDATEDVIIRRLNVSEVEELKAIRLRALSTDRMSFASTSEKESKYDENQWTDFARRAAESSQMVVLVAKPPTGPFVGMVGSFLEGNVSHVWGMWVDPGYRNRGLGGKLLDAILAQIEAVHPKLEVKLGVVSSSEAARQLYRTRGFEETGHTEPLEHTPSVIWYEMVLRRPGQTGVTGAD